MVTIFGHHIRNFVFAGITLTFFGGIFTLISILVLEPQLKTEESSETIFVPAGTVRWVTKLLDSQDTVKVRMMIVGGNYGDWNKEPKLDFKELKEVKLTDSNLKTVEPENRFLLRSPRGDVSFPDFKVQNTGFYFVILNNQVKDDKIITVSWRVSKNIFDSVDTLFLTFGGMMLGTGFGFLLRRANII